jgi:hypothetical protein
MENPVIAFALILKTFISDFEVCADILICDRTPQKVTIEPKGPYTPSILFAGLACACKYVIQVCQKHTLSGMFVKLVCVNSYEIQVLSTHE